jgi:hypothetical protein
MSETGRKAFSWPISMSPPTWPRRATRDAAATARRCSIRASSAAASCASSSKKKLYVNTETGLYTCFVCGSSGGTYVLQKHFGDDPKKPEPGTDPRHPPQDPELGGRGRLGDALQQRRHPLYLMEERGLSPETIVEAKLGYVGGGWSLTKSLPEQFTRRSCTNTGLVWKDGPRQGRDFFYSHLLIPY